MKRALVVLLLVAACGGGSDGNAAKTAYLSKAEAVCATANGQIAAAKKQTPTSVAAVPPYVHRLVEVARTDVQQLTALTPPPGDKADLEAKLLGPLRQQLADADAFAAQVDAAAKAKDDAKLLQLVTNAPLKTRADLTWMKAYGFVACTKAADTGALTGA